MSLNVGQWIDLGVHYEACIVDPPTCGDAGGAISIWLRVLSDQIDGGLLTTINKNGTDTSTGIQISDYSELFK